MIGEVIGNYEVIEKIGQGGMGAVYRARDSRLQRFVALKILPTEVADQETRKRFLQEARAASSLNHPGIVTIFDILEHKGQDVIVMELVRGDSLRHKIQPEGSPWQDVLKWAIDLAEAVSAAHEAGIVHRDLKPDNVMFTHDERLKLLDFGLAKLGVLSLIDTDEVVPDGDLSDLDTAPIPRFRDEKEFLKREAPEIETALLTAAGTTAGTAAYMSPEQAVGEAIDARTDVFAFGVVLYELLAGRRPFSAPSLPALLDQVVNLPPSPLAEIRTDLPDVLVGVVKRAMHKDPEERYQKMADLLSDLRILTHLQDPSAVVTRTATGLSIHRVSWWNRPPVRRFVKPVIALLLLVLVLGSGFLLRRHTERPSVAVIGFNNIVGDPEAAWLSTALAELLHSRLAGGGEVRLIPGARVSRMMQELQLTNHNSYDLETLAKIRRNLDVRHVVNGSYLYKEGRLAVQLFLQNTGDGELDAAIQQEGGADEIFEISQRLGSALRSELGINELSQPEEEATRAAISTKPQATKLYFEGLERMRRFDAAEGRNALAKAVELDSEYAPAQAALGQAWAALGYDEKARTHTKRAFELRKDLSRREALLVEAQYYEFIGDWPRTIDAYRQLAIENPLDLDQKLQWISALIESGNRDRSAEASTLLEQLRSAEPPAGKDPRIDLLEAELAHARSDFAGQLEVAQRALAEAQVRSARWLQAEASYQQAVALFGLGRLDEAVQAARRGTELFLELGAREQAVRVLITHGNSLKNLGRTADAEQTYREALAVAEQTGDRDQTSTLLNNLALMLRDRGELKAAREMLKESLVLAREIGDRRRVAVRWNTLGGIELLLGRLSDAKDMALTALEIDQDVERPWGIVWDLDLLGRIEHAGGQDDIAAKHFEQALVLCEEHDLRSLGARVRTDLAALRIDQENLDEASRLLDAAQAIQSELGEKSAAIRTLRLRGLLHLAAGNPDAAEETAQQAQRELVPLDLTDEEILVTALLARLKLLHGEPEVASALFQRAQIQAERSENFLVRMEAALVTATLKAAQDEQAEAHALFTEMEQEASRRGFVRLAQRTKNAASGTVSEANSEE